eukprot:scaffold22025_cov122-Isochrysis_galbana.AAC.4
MVIGPGRRVLVRRRLRRKRRGMGHKAKGHDQGPMPWVRVRVRRGMIRAPRRTDPSLPLPPWISIASPPSVPTTAAQCMPRADGAGPLQAGTEQRKRGSSTLSKSARSP